jgi:hypothetical protein
LGVVPVYVLYFRISRFFLNLQLHITPLHKMQMDVVKDKQSGTLD